MKSPTQRSLRDTYRVSRAFQRRSWQTAPSSESVVIRGGIAKHSQEISGNGDGFFSFGAKFGENVSTIVPTNFVEFQIHSDEISPVSFFFTRCTKEKRNFSLERIVERFVFTFRLHGCYRTFREIVFFIFRVREISQRNFIDRPNRYRPSSPVDYKILNAHPTRTIIYG